jgi:hypothetical protein
MFSRALIPELNVLDFRVLKGQTHDKICLCKSEKPVLHLEPPYLKNHSFQTADFKNLKAVREP